MLYPCLNALLMRCRDLNKREYEKIFVEVALNPHGLTMHRGLWKLTRVGPMLDDFYTMEFQCVRDDRREGFSKKGERITWRINGRAHSHPIKRVSMDELGNIVIVTASDGLPANDRNV